MQMRHTSSKMPKVKIMSCFATLGPSQFQLLIFTGRTLIMAVLSWRSCNLPLLVSSEISKIVRIVNNIICPSLLGTKKLANQLEEIKIQNT